MKRINLVAALLFTCIAGTLHGETTGTSGTFSTGPNGESILYGQTKPVASVEVPAGMKGQLAQINVKEGQTIKKGDTLAKLDDGVQLAAVELAKQKAESTVEIRYAEAQVKFSQNEYDRVKSNSSSNQSEILQKNLALDQAKLALEIAQEKQRESRTDLKREQITLDHMTILSPIDGRILRVNKQPGEETDENPLVIVVQTNRLSAFFFPPKQLFGKIHVGDKVTLRVEEKPREALVVAVDPVLDLDLFRVKLEFDNADGTIPAGSPATWTWTGK